MRNKFKIGENLEQLNLEQLEQNTIKDISKKKKEPWNYKKLSTAIKNQLRKANVHYTFYIKR